MPHLPADADQTPRGQNANAIQSTGWAHIEKTQYLNWQQFAV
jgi:hypothetical protein